MKSPSPFERFGDFFVGLRIACLFYLFQGFQGLRFDVHIQKIVDLDILAVGEIDTLFGVATPELWPKDFASAYMCM